MKLEPATAPTMYFLGVSTLGSSIRRVFPRWAQRLGLSEAALTAVDLPIGTAPRDYRQVLRFLRGDPLARGALVTTHKIDVYRSGHDLLDVLDGHAQSMREVSCISKEPDGSLRGWALDPLTSGLAVRSFLPATHWRDRNADTFIIGAGGAATALAWYLTHDSADRPRRIVVSDRNPERLDALRELLAADGDSAGSVEYLHVSGNGDNDAMLRTLAPGSLIVNASGVGKDRPGSPLSDRSQFPSGSYAWDFNYRGELRFLQQAQAQAADCGLTVVDGWTYFVHGWLQAIGRVFNRAMPTSGPLFEELAALAAGVRA